MPIHYDMYIDDLRIPPADSDRHFHLVRSSGQAIAYVELHGCPEFVSFDHDLGGEDTSMVFIKWLIEKDLDMKGEFIPEDFHYQIHSANPVGSANIQGLLNNYLNLRNGGK